MKGKILDFLGLQDEEIIEEGVEHEEGSLTRRSKNNNNIVSIHSSKNVKVVLYEPQSYEETQVLADHLRSKRPIIVNLHQIDGNTARRIVDFLSGCVYALNGNIKKIGQGIFLFTPENFDIQGEITELLSDDEEIENY